MDQLPNPVSQELRENIVVRGTKIYYTIFMLDGRTAVQKTVDNQNLSLNGNLNVYIPGHGQKAATATNLLNNIIVNSTSKVVWSIDIDPQFEGDPVKAAALHEIIISKLPRFFTTDNREIDFTQQIKVTLFGWSHGGAEALRIKNIGFYEHIILLCPAGLINRSWIELLVSFLGEGLNIFVHSLLKLDGTIWRVLEIGFDILTGVLIDFFRSLSLCLIKADIEWASRKVVGSHYDYCGTVIIIFGKDDTVIRWKDVFPDCNNPNEIQQKLRQYQKENFPFVKQLKVRVIPGNHISPEMNADVYMKLAYHLLDR